MNEASATVPSNPEPRSTLPQFLTSFVGREGDVANVARLLQTPSVRLVTLTGFGGIGKTRLAVAVAEQTANLWQHVSFISLVQPNHQSNAYSPDHPESVIAIERLSQSDSTIFHNLLAGPCLLIIDNFEQVIDAAEQIPPLLHEWPHLRVLATSRVPLQLSSERVYSLPPLETVGLGNALALFAERAQARDHRFSLTPDNAEDIRQICQRLDGIPLAIELAAARAHTLPPHDMLHHLDSQLSLLTGGPSDAPAHQRTLRDTIRWSYDLLTADEQQIMRALSAFTGGFTLEAAQTVLNLSESQMLDSLARLIDRSLVHFSPSLLIPRMRYRLLDTVREFCFEALVAHDEAHAVRLAHARFFTDLAESSLPLYDGPELYPAMRRMCAESENARSAVLWSLSEGNREDGVRLAGALWRQWPTQFMGDQTSLTDRLEEGNRLITLALNHSDGLPWDAMREALIGAALYEVRTQAVNRLTDMLRTRAIEEDDAYAQYWAVECMQRAEVERGESLSEDVMLGTRLLELGAKCRNPENQMAGALLSSTALLHVAGRYEEAWHQAEAALAMARKSGNPLFIWEGNFLLGVSGLEYGELTESFTRLQASMCESQAADDYGGINGVMVTLARLALRLERVDLAIELLQETWHDNSYAFDGYLRDLALAELRDRAGEEAWHATTRNDSDGPPMPREQILAEMERVLNHQSHPSKIDEMASALSPREQDVLRLLAAGASNRAIGEQLFISERTAENHVQHILGKLNLASRTAAAAWAIHNHLA